jgi:hypothetical protein
MHGKKSAVEFNGVTMLVQHLAEDTTECCSRIRKESVRRLMPGTMDEVLPPMPDLKLKLETLIAGAAECEMIGSLAADPAKRAAYRQRAQDMRELAERVRTQIGARPRRDIQFLSEQALRCRSLADALADDALKIDLLALADELEQTAMRERGLS